MIANDATLAGLLRQLCREARAAQRDESFPSFGHGVHALPGNRLLITPRARGESRYPYVHDGMNFWVYGSGYMHANDGLFALFPRRTEGQEPGIAFMAATPAEDGWKPFPLLGVPHTPEDDAAPADRFAVFSRTHACFVTVREGLRYLLRVLPVSSHEIVFTLCVLNEGTAPESLLLSAFFNPMLRHQLHETDEDRWFRSVRIRQRADHAASFLFHVNEDKDRTTSLAQYAIIDRQCVAGGGAQIHRTEETPSRVAYMGGVSRSLANARSLRTGTFGESCSRRTFVEPTIAGDMIHLQLPPGGSFRADYVFRVTEDHDQALHWHKEGTAHRCLENVVAEREAAETRLAASLALKVAESRSESLSADAFNAFLPHLMKQVEFCSLIRGYVQLSENSLIGIRDIFQALEALTYWRPDAARAKMLEALGFTLEDGRCLRQYSLPNRNGEPGRADVRPFIDQGVWVISAITTYVRLTGDAAFLSESCGYHRLVDPGSSRVVKSTRVDLVLDHLRRILDYMLAQIDPRTGCLRALYGDWNDALDGLGTLPGDSAGYGTGVSVMASLQLLQNLREMRELLQHVPKPGTMQELDRLGEQEERLATSLLKHAIHGTSEGSQRIIHGWGHEGSYCVGSYHDVDGASRDSLTSNAFWVLSGMLERHPRTRADILAAFDRLDSKYGLRTFQPEFPAGEGRFGRIGKLPPGTAENAGTYAHATAFGIMALFEMGEPQRAWRQLEKILPFAPLHTNLSHSPFVMPNSYGYNPELGIDGQNMNDWQTGSSNVVLKTILRHVVGLRVQGDSILLRPAAWCPFRNWQVQITARTRRFQIHYSCSDVGARTFTVNGEQYPGQLNAREGAVGILLDQSHFPEKSIVQIVISD